MTTLLRATGHFATPHASKYMQQLCKHFGHKIEVSYTETEARAAMLSGPAQMWADETKLKIEVSAPDAETLERAKTVIDKHLARFAFREEFSEMAWH